MTTIAFIGGDGAGKTTIANAVIQSSEWRMKYLYMGFSTRSSNRALPTSQLVLFIKRRIYKRENHESNRQNSTDIPAEDLEYTQRSHGWLWNTARFLNRLAEACYRQLISMTYQSRGYIVIFDRHFFFDAAPVDGDLQDKKPLDCLFFWLIDHLYPRPKLTIFLDAPPILLYQRKGEATVEYLENQRRTYLEQGAKLPHFIKIDASQPFDVVFAEVMQRIREFNAGKGRSR